MGRQIDTGIYLVVSVFLPALATTSFARQIRFIDPTTVTDQKEPNRIIAGSQVGYEYHFEVDQAQSQITVTTEIDLPLYPSQADSDSSPVTGWLDTTLCPGRAPFLTIHITDMDMELSEDIDLRYFWPLLGNGSVQGIDIGISMYQPGPETSVVDCNFLQLQNLLSGRGIFQYDMPLVGQDQFDLSEMGYIESDLEGRLEQDGTTIMLTLEIDIEYPLETEELGQVGTAWIQGTVVATAELSWSVADLNGDGFVNFCDFAVLAAAWLSREGDSNYNYYCDISIPADNLIDGRDPAVLVVNWLKGTHMPPLLPGQATNPNPPDSATEVSGTLDLSWTEGFGAASHDVYFGWSDPPPFMRNQTETRVQGGTLAPATIYYWRIDERNKWGRTEGPVWSFTTTASPPAP